MVSRLINGCANEWLPPSADRMLINKWLITDGMLANAVPRLPSCEVSLRYAGCTSSALLRRRERLQQRRLPLRLRLRRRDRRAAKGGGGAGPNCSTGTRCSATAKSGSSHVRHCGPAAGPAATGRRMGTVQRVAAGRRGRWTGGEDEGNQTLH